jgi:hypothetical protein
MADVRRSFDDYDDADLDISIKRPSGSTSTGWIIAVVGLILVGMGGIGVVVFYLTRDDTAQKLPGSWRGQFVFAGEHIDSVYTFQANGNFREESLNKITGQRNVSTGRWHANGRDIQIDWDGGGIEDARITWIDDNTLEYHIVDHDDVRQIGSKTKFQRK